jgi:hypothetical protein
MLVRDGVGLHPPSVRDSASLEDDVRPTALPRLPSVVSVFDVRCSTSIFPLTSSPLWCSDAETGGAAIVVEVDVRAGSGCTGLSPTRSVKGGSDAARGAAASASTRSTDDKEERKSAAAGEVDGGRHVLPSLPARRCSEVSERRELLWWRHGACEDGKVVGLRIGATTGPTAPLSPAVPPGQGRSHTRCAAQGPQKTPPQCRQWWRRRKNVKTVAHRQHCSTDLSSFQWRGCSIVPHNVVLRGGEVR